MSGKVKVAVGILVAVLVVWLGWQIGACELANTELRDDLRVVAAQMGARIGLEAPSSDEELKKEVINRAAGHDIELEPGQIAVKRTTGTPPIELMVDYTAKVKLGVWSFDMDFTTTSAR